MIRNVSRDYGDSSATVPSWYDELGDEGPKPYETEAWTYSVVILSEEEEAEEESQELWWESLLSPEVKPYATAAWTYHQEVVLDEEFVRVSLSLFVNYDEEFYPRLFGKGIVLDSGTFDADRTGAKVYDGAYFLGEERFTVMKRKLARVLVYDQLADSPGVLPLIPQPLGILTTDSVTTNSEIEGDGALLGSLIEAARVSNEQDDRPPGNLLGSVSYEILDTIATITDWEHLNWQDDTPVYRAVKVILNELPECISEVKVLDPPHAFWTSLGFKPDYKGDPYLHFRAV